MLSIAICVYCITIDFWADIDIGSQIPVVLELTPWAGRTGILLNRQINSYM